MNDSHSQTATAEPEQKTKRQPPYAVILHNDDINGFEHVVLSIQKVFGYNTVKTFKMVLQAHEEGRSCLWTGMREHAELKADQLRSCGPDPVMANRGALALRVTIEPLPQ